MRSKVRRIRRPSPALVVAVLALVVAVGGVAFASIPDQSGVIRGCYSTTRGDLRVTDTDTNTPPSCTSTETAISWNQAGPQGTQGPQGPQGQTGPIGPKGPNGAKGNTGAAGPSHAYTAKQTGYKFMQKTYTNILSVNVPTGHHYVAFAKVQGGGPIKDGGHFICRLTAGGDVDKTELDLADDTSGAEGTVSLNVVASPNVGTVKLSCRQLDDRSILTRHSRLSVIQVGAVN